MIKPLTSTNNSFNYEPILSTLILGGTFLKSKTNELLLIQFDGSFPSNYPPRTLNHVFRLFSLINKELGSTYISRKYYSNQFWRVWSAHLRMPSIVVKVGLTLRVEFSQARGSVFCFLIWVRIILEFVGFRNWDIKGPTRWEDRNYCERGCHTAMAKWTLPSVRNDLWRTEPAYELNFEQSILSKWQILTIKHKEEGDTW